MIIGIFSHFFALETTLAERQFLRAIARLVGRRAARLSACGIASIVSRMGYLDEGCSVGADGSLYNVSTFVSNLIMGSNHCLAVLCLALLVKLIMGWLTVYV
jgi:hexokinase